MAFTRGIPLQSPALALLGVQQRLLCMAMQRSLNPNTEQAAIGGTRGAKLVPQPCNGFAAWPLVHGPVQCSLPGPSCAAPCNVCCSGACTAGGGGALCAWRFPGDDGRAAPRGSGAASGLPQGVAGLRGGPVLRRLPHRGRGRGARCVRGCGQGQVENGGK